MNALKLKLNIDCPKDHTIWFIRKTAISSKNMATYNCKTQGKSLISDCGNRQ